MAFARDEVALGFARLPAKLILLLADPAQLGNGVGPRHFHPGARRGYQGDIAQWRVDGEVDVLDCLEGDGNVQFTQPNARLCHG